MVPQTRAAAASETGLSARLCRGQIKTHGHWQHQINCWANRFRAVRQIDSRIVMVVTEKMPMTEPRSESQASEKPETEVVDEAADRRLANIVLGVGLLLLIGI